MNTNPNSNLQVAAENELEPRGEVAASIKLFHDAMHSIADRATERPVPSDWLIPARRRQRSGQRRMILAWSCAAALCFSVVPLTVHTAHPGIAPPPPTVSNAQPAAVEQPTSEDALLEQIDNEVSESVPSSLAPLSELDSWNSTTSTTESSIHTEKSNVTQ